MKPIKVAINGFGRIGRVSLRVIFERNDIEVVAINDLADARTLAHLLKYDSVHRRFPGEVIVDGNSIIVNGKSIPVTAEKDPSKLNWGKFETDIVIESTGRFLDIPSATMHLKAGAKKVLLSAPPDGNDIKSIVMGVNDSILTKDDLIISNASCTTNCAAPLPIPNHRKNKTFYKCFWRRTHDWKCR